MGQYHKLVNLDKKEFVHPHGLGNGLKLYEQIGSRTGIPQAMHVLLCASPEHRGGGDYHPEGEHCIGRWIGDRVMIVGDYAKSSDYAGHDLSKVYFDESYTDITPLVRKTLEPILGVKYSGDGWMDVTKDPAARYSVLDRY